MTKFKLSRIKMSTKYTDLSTDADGWRCHAWKVTLSYQRRRLSTPFYTGTGISGEPTMRDVLACHQSDVQAGASTFEDFCSDFGYNPDSRKAEATWLACRAVRAQLEELLGSDFEAFMRTEINS